jgi:hypothetical protein
VDLGYGVAIDSSGNVHFTGTTNSPNFPIASALQPVLRGASDVHVVKLNATGSAVIYSTYFGGTGLSDGSAEVEIGYDIAMDSGGNPHIAGYSNASDFPVTADALDNTNLELDFGDFVLFKLGASGSPLLFSTYLGGQDDDYGSGVAVNGSSGIYLTGSTCSSDFPLVNPIPDAASPCATAAVKLGDPALTVRIDIKPGSFPNSINPSSRGNIPVAILSGPGFNAPNDVDLNTLTFGRTGTENSLQRRNNGTVQCAAERVDGDSISDLVCHFDTPLAGFLPGDTVGILKAKLKTGTPFSGSDSVRIVP